MVSCRHCGVANTATSKFCSQCGWAIDAADAQSASAVIASEVAEGQRLFGENRHAEALAVAEQVLLSDPDNVPALALKGDCLERNGDIEGALAAYENVVTLKPDSPLDRIRVAQLRRMASAPALAVPEAPSRRTSLLAGVAAFVLLTATGSAIVLANKKEKTVADVKPAAPEVSSVPFSNPAPVPTQSKPLVKTPEQVQQQPGANTAQTPTSDPSNRQENGNSPSNTTKVATSRPVPFGGTLPDGNGMNGYRPVSPNVPDHLDTPTKTTITNSDPDPVPERTAEKPKEDKNERSPIIDIHPSEPEQKSVGGSQTRDGNESTALIRVARQYFLAGDYDKAAKSYERAIKLGASSASANHRLAQCYLNLRRRPEALGAYQRALSAYQRMEEQGVGDKRLIDTYIEECRQAIKLLQ